MVARQAKERRVLIYHNESAAVILAPDPSADLLRGWLNQRPDAAPPKAEALVQALPSLGLHFLWRDLISYLPEPSPQTSPPPEVIRLKPEHAGLLGALHGACTNEDCALGEVEIDHPVVLGYIDQGRLLGSASYIFDPVHPIADIGVLVHPQARRRGIAQALVAALCAPEYASERVAQYMTQNWNLASQRVAQSSGSGCAWWKMGSRSPRHDPRGLRPGHPRMVYARFLRVPATSTTAPAAATTAPIAGWMDNFFSCVTRTSTGPRSAFFSVLS